MKKISKELLKTYYLIILSISLFSLISIFAFSYYIWNESKKHIKTVETFLDYEFKEFETKEELKKLPDGKLFEVVLEEAPKISDTYLEIFYKGNKYTVEPLLPNKKLNSIDYITKINEYTPSGFDRIEVHITKRFTKSRLLVQYIIGTFLIFMGTCLGIIISIQKKFYNKFNGSLENLIELTQNFNLNSDIKHQKENNFIEFYMLQQSFLLMMNRIQEQSKTQISFINNASHELKTPIFVLKGYIDMLSKWGKDDENLLNESLDIMKKETINMQTLVENLLFLAKNKNINSVLSNVNLNSILIDIIKKLSIVYPAQKINYLENEIFVTSDKFLLNLLFTNIIENALKYGNNKDINILTEITNTHISIAIQDFGIGISKEALPHIFEPFYREDESRNRELKSHGLGLSIVKEIVNLLDLDIHIDSIKDIGTSVKISFLKKNELL